LNTIFCDQGQTIITDGNHAAPIQGERENRNVSVIAQCNHIIKGDVTKAFDGLWKATGVMKIIKKTGFKLIPFLFLIT
jgi:hypothetical protein